MWILWEYEGNKHGVPSENEILDELPLSAHQPVLLGQCAYEWEAASLSPNEHIQSRSTHRQCHTIGNVMKSYMTAIHAGSP